MLGSMLKAGLGVLGIGGDGGAQDMFGLAKLGGALFGDSKRTYENSKYIDDSYRKLKDQYAKAGNLFEQQKADSQRFVSDRTNDNIRQAMNGQTDGSVDNRTVQALATTTQGNLGKDAMDSMSKAGQNYMGQIGNITQQITGLDDHVQTGQSLNTAARMSAMPDAMVEGAQAGDSFAKLKSGTNGIFSEGFGLGNYGGNKNQGMKNPTWMQNIMGSLSRLGA